MTLMDNKTAEAQKSSEPITLKSEQGEFSHEILYIKEDNGLDFIEIENKFATAKLALQGGHLMTWHPKHTTEPVLWMSDKSRFEVGRSIRGGIPICWPWFGAHPTDSSLCMHGFARVTPFTLIDVGLMKNGYTRVILQMQQTENAQRQLSYPYTVMLTIEIGETLSMKLSTTNRARQPFFMGEAFHTYFNIGDIEKTTITGLEDTEYADKLLDYWRDTQVGPIEFNQEFDRVYVSTIKPVVIHDKMLNRTITINKTGSGSTVVWTPWKKKAHEIADMPKDDSWRKMVCVETANAMENLVMINPGYTHVLTVDYVITEL